MLRLKAEAVTVEPESEDAPEVSLNGPISRCRAVPPGHCGRLRPEAGLLARFGVRFQGSYSLVARQMADCLGNIGSSSVPERTSP
jgi:hypothetical protein